MSFPERRHVERIEPSGLLYLDLKPDNGGLVLNVSKEGLCFQSVAPVNKHQLLTFSFAQQDSLRDGMGEVVWIDKSRKFGGLRFTRVTARESDQTEEEASTTTKASAREETADLVPWAAEEEPVSTALATVEVAKSSPVHIALFREANRLPAIDLPVNRSRRGWVQTLLLVVLAIYSVSASIVLYRHIGHAGAATRAQMQASTAVKPISSSPGDPASRTATFPAASTIVKPEVGNRAARRTKPTIARPVAHLVEPERPLIQSAPVRWELPEVAAGSPSGRVQLRLLINGTGRVEAIRVISGRGGLVAASIRAARHWRYRPLQVAGSAVGAEAHIAMRFSGDDAVSVSFHE